MSTQIANQLKEVIEKESESLNKDSKTQNLIKASEKFESLVKEGIIERRGYTLMTTDDAHLHQMSFNVR